MEGLVTTSRPKKTAAPDLSQFETSLGELEKIVERMEKGEQTLEESLRDFERGMALSKSCENILKKAEQRVEKLVRKQGGDTLEAFPSDD